MDELSALIESSKQFDYSIGSMLFISVFILFISFFHTVILVGIYCIPLKPKYILALIDAILCVAAMLFFKEYMLIMLVALFLLTFVLAILGMFIVGPILGMVSSVRNNKRSGKQTNVFQTMLLSLLSSVGFFGSFFLMGIMGPILVIVIMGIIQKARKGGTYSFYRTERQLPTSTIRSVAIGLAEIQGKTVKTQLQKAPYSSDMCIGYFSTIEKISRDKDNDKSYTTISTDKNIRPFSIQDATGKIAIDTEDLIMEAFPIHYRYESGDKRYTQYLIEDNVAVLLIGQAFWHDTLTMMMRKDDHSNLFSIIPVSVLEFKKKLRPVLQYLGGFFVIWVLSIVLIINTPMEIKNNELIIGTPTLFDWKENLEDVENTFNDALNFFNHKEQTTPQSSDIETWPEDASIYPDEQNYYEGVNITADTAKSEE